MSKIIRTARIAGPVVTLGEAERGLYLKKGRDKEDAGIDLAGLLEARVTEVCQQLETEWEQRLQQEKDALQAAADQRLQESETQWKTELEQISRQRYEEGHQTGLDEREAEAREAVERLDVLHQAFKQERAQLLHEAEGLVVDLAIAVARRIIGVQVECDEKLLMRVIRTALQHMGEESNLEIKVHPDDLQIARRFAQLWVQKVDQDAVLKVRPSEHVSRGGCMVEGREESVDARLEEQLQVLHQALRTTLGNEEEPSQEAAEGPTAAEEGDL